MEKKSRFTEAAKIVTDTARDNRFLFEIRKFKGIQEEDKADAVSVII